ncbi:MAG: neutral/alkaline non-lysosomal ceramidase N-terminal domain-containing protein [Oscillospiraceae bacterium]|nr:neutral/alkaline non-lysosomal ceramidase N-terminal domain-containing protein [Oscillospiraceae bacterium]
MKLGFARADITPDVGVELGGYAPYRPCAGVHDRLYCKTVVLEQDGQRYALMVLDMLCVDEALAKRIAQDVAELGIPEGHLIAAAIHTHAGVCGVVAGEGALAAVNRFGEADAALFGSYIQRVIRAAVESCREAVSKLEHFTVRKAQGEAPVIGSERHTGQPARATLTVLQCRTESGRSLTLYQLPCHPTVLSAANGLASADFVGGIEPLLDTDMAVFINGAAGDISTRFTRREATFAECDRMARIAAEAVTALIESAEYTAPTPLKGLRTTLSLQPRPLETVAQAEKKLSAATRRWQAAVDAGEEPGAVRILRSYVEGAGVNLEFAQSMQGIRSLELPVSVFSLWGLEFVTVPGELFSTLWQHSAVPICYANGYYRYIADQNAYEAGYYEAMAAILARGQGEIFAQQAEKLLTQLKNT